MKVTSVEIEIETKTYNLSDIRAFDHICALYDRAPEAEESAVGLLRALWDMSPAAALEALETDWSPFL